MTNLIDPRENIIAERFKDVKKIFLVSGFKGGIGKSLISSSLSLAMNDLGFKTGLLDMDITSSTDHIILGVKDKFPEEKNGILPVEIYGIKFMSFYFFTMSKPFALRGNDIKDAVKELLCVTVWDKLDCLIIDMPPGFSDAALELMRLINNFKVILVRTPSPLSIDIVSRMSGIYKDKGFKTIIVNNMSKDTTMGNSIRYDTSIDDAIGNVTAIKKTQFYRDVLSLSSDMIKA
ncbi:MAG: P-loop NTPase [Elusimicrobiales bacterium]|jgi:ATP-binding protein involved in chromosome partitioning|nr:P-loop NTPase [Elusimicrobiales bacterium]NLH40124.1 ATP-binding protein [Elusimicrobiota bacterium]